MVLDLRLEPAEGDAITLAELTALVRRPGELRAALRGEAHDEVVVLRDELPLSGVQAGAMLVAAAARAKRFDGTSRARFAARAALATARALPVELWRSVRLYRRAARAAGADVALPRTAQDVRSALYLRTEPSLRWHGHMVGGASTHTTGVINGLVANGVDLEVLAAERPEGIAAPFTAVPMRDVHHLVPWLTQAAYSERVAAAARGRRPGFVYQRSSLGAWAGLEVAERAGVPLVLEYNGSELWIARHWGEEEHARLSAPLAALEERNLRSASLIVVVSDALADQLTEAGIERERILVNPNGVDVDRVAPFRARPPREWRAELGLAEAPTVGFVGSFGFWHGVKVLPAIAAHVARTAPEVRWLLIGDGQLHAEVRAEVERAGLADRVEMPGIVPHERALAMLSACEVCVSPHVPNPDGTRFFGSPTKLFEYMGLARPIVASDLEQLGEVVEDGRTGLLVPPGDAAAAGDAVLRLLGDPDLRERLGAAALERARTTYSWKAHARRILDRLA